MAVLNEGDRSGIWAEFMRQLSAERQAVSISKVDLRAVIDALDQYMSDNEAAINQVIPQPGRSQLTVQQKAMALMYVVGKRYEVT